MAVDDDTGGGREVLSRFPQCGSLEETVRFIGKSAKIDWNLGPEEE
jgi:hypothetical protein